MATKYGIQVYEILDNGNLLNGIYTDRDFWDVDKGIYHIDNEIAVKIKPDNKGIEGKFNCRFIDIKVPSVQECQLTIEKFGAAYKFLWLKGNLVSYEGIGLMTDSTHIAVAYIPI